jgi:hypothetical protein
MGRGTTVRLRTATSKIDAKIGKKDHFRSGFQIRNENFFVRSRKSRDSAEAYVWYAAQGIPQIDAEIAEKGHFWMETN